MKGVLQRCDVLFCSACVCSIEEDFVTWSEALWPVVCQRFGVDSALDTSNVREYTLTVHSDLSPERVFTGEPQRLRSFANQKP